MLDIVFVPPAEIVAASFTKLGLGFRSFREPLIRSVKGVIAPSIQHNFNVGGRPAWPPLAEATIIKKLANGYPLDILVETGLLKQVAGQYNLWHISNNEARFVGFPRADYGEYHETGTEKMPQREFLLIQPEDEEEIEQVFFTYIRQKIYEAGFV